MVNPQYTVLCSVLALYGQQSVNLSANRIQAVLQLDWSIPSYGAVLTGHCKNAAKCCTVQMYHTTTYAGHPL